MIKDYFKNRKGAWQIREWPEYSCNFQTGEIIGPDGKTLPLFKDRQVKERAQRYCVSLPVSWDNGICVRTAFKKTFVHRLILFSSPGFSCKEGYVIHHKNGDHFDNRLQNLEYLTPSEHNHETAMTQSLWRDKRSESLKRTFNNPEFKAAHQKQFAEHAERLKRRWAESHDEMKNRIWNQTSRQSRIDKMKAHWADPEKRMELMEALNSPEVKEKRIAASKAVWANRSQEQKNEIGRKISQRMAGHEVSKQTRQKIAQKQKNKLKRVAQIDLEGHQLREFESLTQAQRQTGIPSANIGRVCRRACKTAGGYCWKFLDSNEN